MIMCVLLCYPVSIRTYYQQGVLFLVTNVPLIHSGYNAHQKDLALASCIQSLLSKNAIERVENVKSLRFYSCLFLVPKPPQPGPGPTGLYNDCKGSETNGPDKGS